MECPYGSLVQHEEEKRGGGEGDDEVTAEPIPLEKPVPAVPEPPPVERETGEEIEDRVLDALGEKGRKKPVEKSVVEQAEEVIRDLPVHVPATVPETGGKVPDIVRKLPVPQRGPSHVVLPDPPPKVAPVGDVAPLLEAVAKVTKVKTSGKINLPSPPSEEDFLQAQESFVALAGAYGTSVVQDFVPGDFLGEVPGIQNRLLERLRGPVKTRDAKGVRIIAIPRTRDRREEVKSENLKAGVSEEAFLQAMELGVRSRRVQPDRVSSGRRLPLAELSIIGGSAAAAAGAGGFFFNARNRLKGLLQ